MRNGVARRCSTRCGCRRSRPYAACVGPFAAGAWSSASAEITVSRQTPMSMVWPFATRRGAASFVPSTHVPPMLPRSLNQYSPCLYAICACLRDTERSGSWMVLSGPRPIVAPDFVTSNVERGPRSVSRRSTSPPGGGAVTGGRGCTGTSGTEGAGCVTGATRATGATCTAGTASSTAAILSTRRVSIGSATGAAEAGGCWATGGGATPRFGAKRALILARIPLTGAPPRSPPYALGLTANKPLRYAVLEDGRQENRG